MISEEPPFSRRILSGGLLGVLATAAALGFCETALRVLNPKPRVQVVRNARVPITWTDGVPTWSERGSAERANEACVERLGSRAKTVQFFGDSILFGVGLPPEAAFTRRLQDRLEQSGREDDCVMNFSEPAFTFDGQWATARREIARFHPRIVYWEFWANSPSHYRRLGDDAYNFGDLRVGADGYPELFRLPAGVNRWLFSHSRLYEYAAVAMLRKDDDRPAAAAVWRDEILSRLPALAALARDAGARLVFVFCPPLDRPFDTSARVPEEGYVPVMEFARAHGIETVLLAEELKGESVQRVRLDSCCHYNSAGHELLGELFYRRTLELLASAPPPARRPSFNAHSGGSKQLDLPHDHGK